MQQDSAVPEVQKKHPEVDKQRQQQLLPQGQNST